LINKTTAFEEIFMENKKLQKNKKVAIAAFKGPMT
jgi:hypothetical protein